MKSNYIILKNYIFLYSNPKFNNSDDILMNLNTTYIAFDVFDLYPAGFPVDKDVHAYRFFIFLVGACLWVLVVLIPQTTITLGYAFWKRSVEIERQSTTYKSKGGVFYFIATFISLIFVICIYSLPTIFFIVSTYYYRENPDIYNYI